MRVNERYFEHIEFEEGLRLKPYIDSGGAPTIGIGHLLTKSDRSSGKIIINGVPVRYVNGISKEQAWALCEQDTEKFMKLINETVKAELTQNQFNALVSFAYNIGETAFRNSTLLRRLNEGRYGDIPAQFRRWRFDNGEVNEVLAARREREIKLYLS